MPKSKISSAKEGIPVETQYREVSGAKHCRVGRTKRPMNIAVVARQQTVEEEGKCNAAIELLLTELVRRHLGCKERGNV
jgi:hypothetical protein